jgi:exopolyphosphatase / guanosine-5'-triphosphate,3'-diphosphate pyrophosphatase
MRAAIIDCGTNTFHLLVADYNQKGDHRIIVNKKLDVKLGEGGLINNHISEAAFERGLRAFEDHKGTALSFDADTIEAYATSAIRTASNGVRFVDRVRQTTGININVIDGDREALLISKGVFFALGEINQTSLIMDIGGGSTEFILVKNKEIMWKQSFELGVSRLLQKFRPADPIRHEDIRAIEGFLDSILDPLARQLACHHPKVLIGCSGSFESLSSMILLQKYQQQIPFEIRSYQIHENDYQQLHEVLLASNMQQRYSMPGLVQARVDTIVFASVFINYIKRTFNIQEMIFCNYALKEGVLKERIEELRDPGV